MSAIENEKSELSWYGDTKSRNVQSSIDALMHKLSYDWLFYILLAFDCCYCFWFDNGDVCIF